MFSNIINNSFVENIVNVSVHYLNKFESFIFRIIKYFIYKEIISGHHINIFLSKSYVAQTNSVFT